MSIYELPPAITTPNKSSALLRDVFTKKRLADECLSRVMRADTHVTEISYLPTHESIQYRLHQLHTEVIPAVAEKIADIDRSIAAVELKQAEILDKMQIQAERDADIGLFTNARPMNHAHNANSETLKSLGIAKADLMKLREAVLDERRDAIIEIETLEEKSFELLHVEE